MKKAIITMIVVFALVVWPFSGVWQLLSGIIGGGVQESFIYPIYGGIIISIQQSPPLIPISQFQKLEVMALTFSK